MGRGRKRAVALGLTLIVLAAACTAGDDTTDETGDVPAATEPSATGPAPGVTDDAVKVGVVHVDQEPLRAVGLDFDLGDHNAVYTALFDDINADGGINGRSIEYTILPVDPTQTVVGEPECVRLTEDEDVFVVIGFFLNDGVLCPIDTHATAVVGGTMTAERLERAQAPWLTWQADHEQPEAVVRQLHERGELDGTVAVFARDEDRAETEEVVVPTLEELGVDPVDVAISTAPPSDPVAIQDEVRTIAERFESSGVDTVVLPGASSANWATSLEDHPFRPRLLFLDVTGARAFATSADTTDTSILDDALIGGTYGPDQAIWEEAGMQDCIAVLEEAGLEAPAPESLDSDDPNVQPYQAAFQACPDVALMRAWLEAAGDDLNYGTLAGAADGLTLTVPGNPQERTFGPPTSFDGDPEASFFVWNEEAATFDLADG